MTHGSLFSGIGGFDLAAEWAGWTNIFHCEINPFCQRVLKHYWPGSIAYADIKQTDFTIHRGLDVLSGGFPCQPYSTAGKRKGKEDERHLWPEMLRAVREIQPRYVVGENVRGLTNWNGGMVFDEVQADLEAEGYEVLPFLLPACGKDAPHRRDRIWFVAHAKNSVHTRDEREISGTNGRSEQHNLSAFGESSERYGTEGFVTDRSIERGTPKIDEWEIIGQKRESLRDITESIGCGESSTNSGSEGLQVAVCGELEIIHGTKGTQPGGELGGKFTAIPGWQNFPTQSAVCGGDDGLPRELDGITFPKWRNESIKGYGNAVVPQVVFEIFKAINVYELSA